MIVQPLIIFISLLAPAIQANMATNFSSSSTLMAVCDTPTTQTTATIALFEKKVSISFYLLQNRRNNAETTLGLIKIVWVGPLVVKELKRIVEASEITKCIASLLHHNHRPIFILQGR